MPRALLDAHFVDDAGNEQNSLSINVYKPGTTSAISDIIYSSRTGTDVLANPLTTDSNGDIVGWIAVPGTDVGAGSHSVVRLYNVNAGVDREVELRTFSPGVVAAMTTAVTADQAVDHVTDKTCLTWTVPASFVKNGTTVRFTLFGNADYPSDGSPTSFPVKFKAAGSTIATLSLGVPTSSANTLRSWRAEFFMTVRDVSTPASTTYVVQGSTINNLSSSVANAVALTTSNTTSSFDSTATLALTVTIACGEDTSGYIIRCFSAFAELVVA